MKRTTLVAVLAAIALLLTTSACTKKNTTPAKSGKYQVVTGSWQQTDIELAVAVSVKVGSTKYSFPVGTSMISDPTLKALGVTASFTPTKNNIYHISDSGTYSID